MEGSLSCLLWIPDFTKLQNQTAALADAKTVLSTVAQMFQILGSDFPNPTSTKRVSDLDLLFLKLGKLLWFWQKF